MAKVKDDSDESSSRGMEEKHLPGMLPGEQFFVGPATYVGKIPSRQDVPFTSCQPTPKGWLLVPPSELIVCACGGHANYHEMLFHSKYFTNKSYTEVRCMQCRVCTPEAYHDMDEPDYKLRSDKAAQVAADLWNQGIRETNAAIHAIEEVGKG